MDDTKKKGTHEIIFKDEINNDSVAKLMSLIEANETKKELIRIYFSTSGGDVTSAQILINYLNRKHDEGINIEIIATWEVSSCGFIILCDTKCKKSFMDAWSSVHLGTRTLDYRNLQISGGQEKFLLKHIEEKNEEILERYKEIGLSKEEIDKVSDGQDIILDTTRLKELFS